MKKLQKYLYISVFTVILLGIAIYASPKAVISLPHFLIHHPDSSEVQEISLYHAEDGNYYVFLPSYASPEYVTVSMSQDHLFSVGDFLLSDGMKCEGFALETPYVFAMDHQEIGTLLFCRSANVATMYIDTVSGNMKYLHQNKDHKENVSVMLYNAEGILDHSDKTGILSGRGNATWEYDKRPYNLTLSADRSMLNMNPAKNWVLLANAADETNLNNKLILDLAQRVGLQWTPDSRWVDLYLNGEYSGLYLLTEKVEVYPGRLEIDTNAGDFLCRIDLDNRWSTLRNPFLTEAGRTVEISYPRILSDGVPSRIEAQTNMLEKAICSGQDLRKSPILDLDSWVRRYLIDEISANIDADLASSYFYCSNGKIYAGPIWDYDMTLGNFPRNQDPCAFIAKTPKKSATFDSPYYDALYRNESFYHRMVEIYRTEFVPELQKLLNSDLDVSISTLEKASRSNSLRWRFMYDNLPADVVHTPDALKDYFSRRIRFLDSAWLEKIPYYTVQFESSPGSAFKNSSVQYGHILETPYINTETTVWVNASTGEVVDFRQPIVTDMIVTKQANYDADSDAATSVGTSTKTSLSAMDYFLFLLMAVTVTLVVMFAWIDLLRGKSERQTTATHSDSSP